MKKCSDCGGKMKELTAKTPENIEYRYFKCTKCGEEIVNMAQLQSLSKKYREMKRFNAKLSRWGTSLGLRIPKELAEMYKLDNDTEVTLIPEKEGMKIIPA